MSSAGINIYDLITTENVNPFDVFNLDDTGDIVVILCHFNPCAYQYPIQNLKKVLSWLYTQKLPTYAVELRCGESLNREPILPIGHSKVIQLKSNFTIFRKDNLWNVVADKLPSNFKYILCIDADAIIVGDDWKNNLLRKFDTAKIIQPFSKVLWTDSLGRVFKEKLSWGYGFANKIDLPQISHHFSPGLSIAVTRDFWEQTNGMFNSPIGGGSLFLMSAMMGIENELEPVLENISEAFLQDYKRWGKSVYKWADLKFDFIEATGFHLWHGSRKKRKYEERFERLKKFDPRTDIVADDNIGIYEWSESAIRNKKELIKAVDTYFAIREEDEFYDSKIIH